jgi:hypothetical protein
MTDSSLTDSLPQIGDNIMAGNAIRLVAKKDAIILNH